MSHITDKKLYYILIEEFPTLLYNYQYKQRKKTNVRILMNGFIGTV